MGMALRAACDRRSPIARAASAQERRFGCVFRNSAWLRALAASEYGRALLRLNVSVEVLLRRRAAIGNGATDQNRRAIDARHRSGPKTGAVSRHSAIASESSLREGADLQRRQSHFTKWPEGRLRAYRRRPPAAMRSTRGKTMARPARVVPRTRPAEVVAVALTTSAVERS